MLDRKFYITALILTLAAILTFGFSASAQRPPKNGLEWFPRVDANRSELIEAEEYKAATDEIFKKIDRNKDGVIDDTERPRRPLPPREDAEEGFRPNRPRPENQGPPIPFFVMEVVRVPGVLTRAEYDESVNEQFKSMDRNGDGAVSREEADERFCEVDERVQKEQRREEVPALDSPTAKFIGAELRFGATASSKAGLVWWTNLA